MNWNEFITTVVLNEYPETVEIDLHPFGARQTEAFECWLDAALKDGDPFGKKYVVKMQASVILSQSGRHRLAKLQQIGVSVRVVGER